MMLYDFTFCSVLSILIFVLSKYPYAPLVRARLSCGRSRDTCCCLQGGGDIGRLVSRLLDYVTVSTQRSPSQRLVLMFVRPVRYVVTGALPTHRYPSMRSQVHTYLLQDHDDRVASPETPS